ncbi:hypothetical protein GCK32_002939 [Trichostrongylus colubriformis]|uniref:Uncharacterized protein n=1 Tax=Trichostrongylus colubriformis TaxID=6319 RepID=A0AAN8FN40_TRICO
MTPAPLVADKRLETKRAVRRMARNVRASIRSSLRNRDSKEFWQNLEKSQPDDTSKCCARQLLLMRLELKEALRSASSDEHMVDDLVLKTGLGRESVLSVLKKHGYCDGTEERILPGCSVENEENRVITPKSTSRRFKEGNVSFDMPKLDISEVRNDRSSPEDLSPQIAHVTFEETPRSAKVQQNRKSSTHPEVVEQGSVLVENSPREVTDSSAEISDLAKRFGARLYQDASLIDQLRNVNREKSFVEQLRDVIATSATLSTVQLKFIPSVPLANPAHASTICREIDVQTSICVTELPILDKELHDIATDVPSLDYLSASDLGGLKQLPEAFVTQEDASSSAFSSDQSAGQIARSMINRTHSIIAFDRDGSAQVTPSKTVRVSELEEDLLRSDVRAPPQESTFAYPSKSAGKRSPRTPRVSESPWRPSSRRLHLDEIDISTSVETDSLEVISVGTPGVRRHLDERSGISQKKEQNELESEGKSEIDAVESEHSTKESSDLSHQDEEHTCNQVSQIASE